MIWVELEPVDEREMKGGKEGTNHQNMKLNMKWVKHEGKQPSKKQDHLPESYSRGDGEVVGMWVGLF